MLKIVIDHERKLLIFKVLGVIESGRLTDLIIEAYKTNRSAWTYRRIFDYRRAEGIYSYDEVERLLAWWHAETASMEICNYVAIITVEILFEIRAKIFDEAYTKGQIMSFDTTAKAISWLDVVAPIDQGTA
ncbi:hypothetical protein [Asticcacaulis benevestitus]|uniref:STAS/SEC14 domain-containing protein n=1 Tax=Asticcacaulis benevestitus DSM 16100 = ATCC BAA-896 TaxID=1121022 RepID=V4NTT9_9CAUL|nr:hypothetical protein [Asticcacaulis benevestitus]ESQ78429.1 hypothetical protein ABENE_23120 [Asticcacaulis benevestitus DSM 16100 = ATCC BAA-896]